MSPQNVPELIFLCKLMNPIKSPVFLVCLYLWKTYKTITLKNISLYYCIRCFQANRDVHKYKRPYLETICSYLNRWCMVDGGFIAHVTTSAAECTRRHCITRRDALAVNKIPNALKTVRRSSEENELCKIVIIKLKNFQCNLWWNAYQLHSAAATHKGSIIIELTRTLPRYRYHYN
jgi:hypothetical protein